MRKIDVGLSNAAELLKWLRPGHSSTRAELSERSGLSAATVARFARDLLEDGWLREVERAPASVGRPMQWLELLGERGAVIGVSVLQPAVQAVCLDANGQRLFSCTEEVNLASGAEGFLRAIQYAVTRTREMLIEQNRTAWRLGLALPGQWDRASGVSHFFPRLPDWRDVPLRELCERWSGLHSSFYGYAASLAVAEQARRPMPVPRNMLCVEVSDNIAMGIVANGAVIEGACGNAGELGHIPVDARGPVCYCGSRGCLETLATCTALEDEIHRSDIAREVFADPQRVTFDEALAQAKNGNGFALRMMHRTARSLGMGLAIALNLFNPEKLVLSGRFFRAPDVTLEPVRAAIREHTLPNAIQHVSVELSELGESATAHGAAMAVLSDVYNEMTGAAH